MVKTLLSAVLFLLLVASLPAAELANSVVRIRVDDGTYGSGAYLGDRLVLTAAHLFRDAPKEQKDGDVWFTDGSQYRYSWQAINDHWDQALVELTTVPNRPGAPLATKNPAIGEVVYAYGYGKSNRVEVTAGRVLRYDSPAPGSPADWLVMSGRVNDGSSGGPIFNRYGEVVGNLWGTSTRDEIRTVGLVMGRTRRFLLPWNARLEGQALASGMYPRGSAVLVQGGTCPTCPPMSAPVRSVPTAPQSQLIPLPPSTTAPSTTAPATSGPAVCPPDVQVAPIPPEIDYQRVVQELMANSEFMAHTKGQVGPSGKDGANGRDGRDGTAGEVTAEHLAVMAAAIIEKLKQDAEFIAATTGQAGKDGKDGQDGIPGQPGADGIIDLSTLPPIRIQTLNQDGSVYQDVQARLGDLLRLKPVIVSGAK